MIIFIGPRHSSGAIRVMRATGVARSDEGCFSVGTESVDSWTPGPKPLCHRRPTGPHPSGLLWTRPRVSRRKQLRTKERARPSPLSGIRTVDVEGARGDNDERNGGEL